MSEEALDLSKTSCGVSSKTTSKRHSLVGNDSGGPSCEITVSHVHDKRKVRLRAAHAPPAPSSLNTGDQSTSNCAFGLSTFCPPVHFQDLPKFGQNAQRSISVSTSSPTPAHVSLTGICMDPNSSVQTDAGSNSRTTKPVPTDSMLSDDRTASIRPYTMYPLDSFNVYNNNFLPGTVDTLSPTSINLHSLYDTASPTSFPSLTLTPLTSHLRHRKRRAQSTDSKPSTTSAGSSSTSGKSRSASGDKSESNYSESFRISTTSPTSKDDSNGSDGEKGEKSSGEGQKDDFYWDRRRKNNEAAKRSRDVRRQREEEIAMRAAFLEQENLKLRAQVAVLKNETAKLHYMLYNRV